MRERWRRGDRPRHVTALRLLTVACWLAVAVQPVGAATGHPVGGVRPLLCVVTGLAAVTAAAGALRWSGLQRVAWLLLAGGITGYAAGYLVLFYDPHNHADGIWGVNLSDCISLLLYPLGYAGLSVLALSRHRQSDRAVLLEGALIACGAGAVMVVVADHLYPSLMLGPALHVFYDLAYPVGGFTLLTGTVTGLAVSGWRLDRAWLWLAAGFVMMTAGDTVYGLQAAAHMFSFGSWSELLYTAGPVGVALAASGRPVQAPQRPADPRPAMTVSGLATLTAIGTLVTGHFMPVPTAAVVLAAACGVLAVARTGFFLQQGRLLAQSRALARTDDLTGLPNRRALVEGLRTARLSAQPFSLLLLDLDGFKDVNDSFGHTAGDELLAAVAHRLRAAAWPATVYRLGGDEFAVLHPGPPAAAETLAETLCERIAAPIVIQDARLVVGVSLGIGPVPVAGSDQPTGESLRRADVALYRAKSTGCGVYTWDPSLDVGLEERLRLVAELRAALNGDELVAYFQPQADARTGEVVGFEALVRWQHPRRGLLLPGAFLDAAESAGLLPSITQLMLTRSLAALRSATAAERAISVAVNIGAGDLLDEQFPDKVAQLLTEHRVAPERLVIEVTESVVMTDPDRMITVLDRLRRMGVRIALDDYGTGLASLRYLRTLPLDELKIDRSLVADMDGESSSALIVSSTIQLAHGLGLHVVVEGVERPPAAALLADMGCDAIQGWLVGYPLPRESLTATGQPPGVPVQASGVERESAGRV